MVQLEKTSCMKELKSLLIFNGIYYITEPDSPFFDKLSSILRYNLNLDMYKSVTNAALDVSCSNTSARYKALHFFSNILSPDTNSHSPQSDKILYDSITDDDVKDEINVLSYIWYMRFRLREKHSIAMDDVAMATACDYMAKVFLKYSGILAE